MSTQLRHIHPLARAVRSLLAMAGLLLVGACGNATSPTSEAHTARARWERTRPANYSFTLGRSCECIVEVTRPVVVVVRDGIVTSRTYVQGGDTVDARWAASFPSIDGLFTAIEDATKNADRLDADYDARYGYPHRVSIDYDTKMVDDESTLSVSDFHPL